MVRRRAPDPADRLDQVGAGQRAGRPVVDGVAAVALQRLLCQQPGPGAAAVLQVVGPGGGAARPDGAAAAAEGHQKLIPVFTSVERSKLERACQGRSFAQRRDAAIIAVFEATGIRLSELAGIRYDPVDAERSDLDLWQREITVAARTASSASSRSATRAPGPWTGTSAPAPGTPRPGGRSCGWGSITGGR
jgi:integrase